MAEPGWYDDPTDPTSLRYWDGGTWTDQCSPKAPTSAPHASPWSAAPPPVPSPPSWGVTATPAAARPGAYAPAVPHGTGTSDLHLSSYYQQKFRAMDSGAVQASWNWPAFFFGMFWYLSKGMWGKALLIFFVAAISGGVLALPLWIYTGIMGNYDYWLKHRHGKQMW